MNTTSEKSTGTLYAPGKMAKPVNFYCTAPAAQSVCMTGDFNGWDPTSHPMERRVDGTWFLQVQLPHGHHLYRFLVDGKPQLDPRSAGVARDDHSERASLIAVS